MPFLAAPQHVHELVEARKGLRVIDERIHEGQRLLDIRGFLLGEMQQLVQVAANFAAILCCVRELLVQGRHFSFNTCLRPGRLKSGFKLRDLLFVDLSSSELLFFGGLQIGLSCGHFIEDFVFHLLCLGLNLCFGLLVVALDHLRMHAVPNLLFHRLTLCLDLSLKGVAFNGPECSVHCIGDFRELFITSFRGDFDPSLLQHFRHSDLFVRLEEHVELVPIRRPTNAIAIVELDDTSI
mmetsp:Transcript_50774/g.107731  ORF Transcript_50774/g.107731 Transcript_50774/m.107731 type:complete len:238 (+) Transcript_50774:944-1657(+)